MGKTDFEMMLQGKAGWIDRHRPLLLWIQVTFAFVGAFFYVFGMSHPGVFHAQTWGALAYEQPAWTWGAINMLCSMITGFGLIKPVKNRLVAFGAILHTAQFSAIFNSCFFSGGDYGIGIYALAVAVLHAKIAYEALRWTRK